MTGLAISQQNRGSQDRRSERGRLVHLLEIERNLTGRRNVRQWYIYLDDGDGTSSARMPSRPPTIPSSPHPRRGLGDGGDSDECGGRFAALCRTTGAVSGS